MGLFDTRMRMTTGTLLLFAAFGCGVGFFGGYTMMGTLHAVMEIGAEHHYTETGVQPIRLAAQQEEAQSVTQQVVNTQSAGDPKPEPKPQATQSVVQSVQEPVVQPVVEPAATKEAPKTGRDAWPKTGTGIQVLVTSNGSPYQNYQNRIMIATFKIVQKQPGGEDMVALTRILHRTKGDVLMDQIETFRADPLHPECDHWCEFPVADRANAVAQFFRAAEADPSWIKAPWFLMIETDYVWVKPLQAPPAESNALSLGFPYGYINPQAPPLAGVMRKMYPEDLGPLTDIPNSGPAPILMRNVDYAAVTPEWERLTKHIEDDKQSKDMLGWVREMYAFSIACTLNGVKLDLDLPPKSKLMVQPPADSVLGDAALCHYTWGAIYKNKDGGDLWSWDKRFHVALEESLKVPKIERPPEWRDEGWKMQDGKKVTREGNELMDLMIRTMNEGIDTLEDLTGHPLEQ